MKEKIKRLMCSKIPELICLILQPIALVLLVFVKPCGFAAYLVGLLCGFIITKIMGRIAYTEKKEKISADSSSEN